MVEGTQKSGGGAATQAGINYQNRVAAWVCVRMLAERPAAPLGPETLPTFVRFETAEPTDDLLIGTPDGHSFVQAKRTLSLSGAPDSEFASVIEQFVRQYLSVRNISGPRPWSRPLDPARDRLVLVTTPQASAPLRIHLAAVLGRIRGLAAGQPLADAATNQTEIDALKLVKRHVRRIWKAVLEEKPSEAAIGTVLRLMHITVLDVEADGAAEGHALDLLAMAVVNRPQDAAAVWSRILQIVADRSQRRSGIDAAGMRTALGPSVPLKTARSYQNDVEKLKRYTRATLRSLSHNSRIVMNGVTVRVERRVVTALRFVSEDDSVVVVGVPGAGKSGVLYDYAQSSLDEGRDVICLATDQIGAKTLGELRNELGLEHEILEVMLNWSGSRTAFLVIDALDATRGDPSGAALFALMQAVTREQNRWRVVASIRKYDLRYSPILRQLFRHRGPTVIGQEFQDAEFSLERHVNVPLFTEAELTAVRQQAPHLDQLLGSAPAALHDLLRVPFNLRLMADIVESGVDLAELRPIRTQNELLKRFWQYRVLSAPDANLRERVIQRACALMIEDRRLRVDRQRIVEPGSASALEALLSGQVLIEWQAPSALNPSRQIIAFAHHILFDFAVSQLFLPPQSDRVAEVLARDPDLILIIRPSILMRFEELWHDQRAEFWDLLFAVSATPTIPAVGKVIGASVLGDAVHDVSELAPLLERLLSANAAERTVAETAFRHLVGALTASGSSKLAGPDAGPWCQMLARVTST